MSITALHLVSNRSNLNSLRAISSSPAENETHTSQFPDMFKEYYNVSNFENAFDMMKSSGEVNIFSIGNLSLYVKKLYQISQTAEHESPSLSLSDIYSLLGTDKMISESFLENLVSFFDSNECFAISVNG